MSIEKIINAAWENKDQVSQNSDKSLKDAVNQIIDDLDSGKARVAEKINGFGNCIYNRFIRIRINVIFIFPSFIYNFFNTHNFMSFLITLFILKIKKDFLFCNQYTLHQTLFYPSIHR